MSYLNKEIKKSVFKLLEHDIVIHGRIVQSIIMEIVAKNPLYLVCNLLVVIYYAHLIYTGTMPKLVTTSCMNHYCQFINMPYFIRVKIRFGPEAANTAIMYTILIAYALNAFAFKHKWLQLDSVNFKIQELVL